MSALPSPSTLPAGGPAWAAPLRARWAGMAPRERLAVGAALWAVAIFLLWSLAVAPALKTLREAPLRQQQLDAQLDEMRSLAAEAQALRDTPRVSPAQSEMALRAAVQRMGERARLQIQGDRATVTLQGLPGSEFIALLAEVRAGARARPEQAQLVRTGDGAYNGSIVLVLATGL